MGNFQDAFETRKRSFISAFSICMTVPLTKIHFINILRSKSIFLIFDINKIFQKFCFFNGKIRKLITTVTCIYQIVRLYQNTFLGRSVLYEDGLFNIRTSDFTLGHKACYFSLRRALRRCH